MVFVDTWHASIRSFQAFAFWLCHAGLCKLSVSTCCSSVDLSLGNYTATFSLELVLIASLLAMTGGENKMDKLYTSSTGAPDGDYLNTRSGGKVRKGGLKTPSLRPPAMALLLRYLIVIFEGGMKAKAQPPPGLDPEDTEAIIAAFLDNATTQRWDDTAVNEVLEQILRQDADQGGSPAVAQETGTSASTLPNNGGIPLPVPYHGVNSPISTPTQADEEEPEEGEEEEEVAEDPTVYPQAQEAQTGGTSALGEILEDQMSLNKNQS